MASPVGIPKLRLVGAKGVSAKPSTSSPSAQEEATARSKRNASWKEEQARRAATEEEHQKLVKEERRRADAAMKAEAEAKAKHAQEEAHRHKAALSQAKKAEMKHQQDLEARAAAAKARERALAVAERKSRMEREAARRQAGSSTSQHDEPEFDVGTAQFERLQDAYHYHLQMASETTETIMQAHELVLARRAQEEAQARATASRQRVAIQRAWQVDEAAKQRAKEEDKRRRVAARTAAIEHASAAKQAREVAEEAHKMLSAERLTQTETELAVQARKERKSEAAIKALAEQEQRFRLERETIEKGFAAKEAVRLEREGQRLRETLIDQAHQVKSKRKEALQQSASERKLYDESQERIKAVVAQGTASEWQKRKEERKREQEAAVRSADAAAEQRALNAKQLHVTSQAAQRRKRAEAAAKSREAKARAQEAQFLANAQLEARVALQRKYAERARHMALHLEELADESLRFTATASDVERTFVVQQRQMEEERRQALQLQTFETEGKVDGAQDETDVAALEELVDPVVEAERLQSQEPRLSGPAAWAKEAEREQTKLAAATAERRRQNAVLRADETKRVSAELEAQRRTRDEKRNAYAAMKAEKEARTKEAQEALHRKKAAEAEAKVADVRQRHEAEARTREAKAADRTIAAGRKKQDAKEARPRIVPKDAKEMVWPMGSVDSTTFADLRRNVTDKSNAKQSIEHKESQVRADMLQRDLAETMRKEEEKNRASVATQQYLVELEQLRQAKAACSRVC